METVGTLNLKIARLQQHLAVLAAQALMSRPYPQHQQYLQGQAAQLQQQLDDLIEQQQRLTPEPKPDYQPLPTH
jgi:hypothetical protein